MYNRIEMLKRLDKMDVTMKRKRKFVVWLHSQINSLYDAQVIVWAYSPDEARENAKFNNSKFSVGAVMTAAEFRRNYGFGA